MQISKPVFGALLRSLHSGVNGPIQSGSVGEGLVGQMMCLEIVPDNLAEIQDNGKENVSQWSCVPAAPLAQSPPCNFALVGVEKMSFPRRKYLQLTAAAATNDGSP